MLPPPPLITNCRQYFFQIQANKFQEEKQELQDKFQEEKQELQDKFQEEKQELQDKFQEENQELQDKIQVQLQMISSIEGKHHELMKKTKETDDILKQIKAAKDYNSILKSLEFKVLDPVCPEYNTEQCGKKISLWEMSKHLVSCEHLDYNKHKRNMILNMWEYGINCFLPNFEVSIKPEVLKLRRSQQFFILQCRSVGTFFFFFIIQHISEHQYIARLEVSGETKNITRSRTVRVCPSGINLEDARNQMYTLDISHQDLKKICVREDNDDYYDHGVFGLCISEKYKMFVKLKVTKI